MSFVVKIKVICKTMLIIPALILPAVGGAQIIEISHFQDVANYIDKDSILVLDIDNTIVQPKQLLGSDQWFDNYFASLLQSGFNKTQALGKTLAIYIPVHNISEVQLVEAIIPEIIHKTHKMAVPMIALTSRGKNLSAATVRQLQSVGIDFNKLSFFSGQHSLSHIGQDSGAAGGIIYAAGTSKSLCLLDVLDQLQYYPKKIVFVDDKTRNVKEMDERFLEVGIQHTGLRYAYLDDKVRNFNHKVSNIQLEYFSKILTDEDAKAISDRRGGEYERS